MWPERVIEIIKELKQDIKKKKCCKNILEKREWTIKLKRRGCRKEDATKGETMKKRE